jgi:hypothetical protein
MSDLKERYGFDDWRGRDERLIRKPLPELRDADLELESRDPIDGEPYAFIDFYRLRSRPARIAVTIVEHPSVSVAHEALLHILALVMAPQLPSCEERGLRIGDACFCSLGEMLEIVFFVRANVLVRVENVGREQVDLRDIATRLDELLRLAQGISG